MGSGEPFLLEQGEAQLCFPPSVLMGVELEPFGAPSMWSCVWS